MSRTVFGQVGRLKRHMVEEYRALHAAPWPEVLRTIRECNLRNYSIFLQEDVVFAYFEYVGEDYEADMARMARDPKTRAWWTHTHPCFEGYAFGPDSEFYTDMRQIFYTP